MTIEQIKNRIKEEGKKHPKEITSLLLDRLDNNPNQLERTKEVLENTYNIIPEMFNRVKNNLKRLKNG